MLCSLFAQRNFELNKDSFSITNKHIIKIAPMRAITDKVGIYYEIGLRNNQSIEAKIAYIYPNVFLHAMSNPWFISTAFKHQGYEFGASYRKYRTKKPHQVWSVNVAVSEKFFNNKTIYESNRSGSVDVDEYKMSQDKKMLHLDACFGGLWVKKRIVSEVNIGVGLNLIKASTTYHNYVPMESPFKNDNGWFVWPCFIANYKFGVLVKR